MTRASFIGLAALLLGACPGKGGRGNGTGSSESGACGEVSAHVRAIYAAQPEDSELAPDVQADLLEANVHMILDDCETAPARLTACIRNAKTVVDLEQHCAIQLDDEGRSEGQQFGNAPPH